MNALDDESGVSATQSSDADAIESLAYRMSDGPSMGAFDSVFQYEEYVFGHKWNFLIATKDVFARERWFANEADWHTSRISMTEPAADSLPFLYFDSATLQSYKFPSHLLEDSFCFEKQAEYDKNNDKSCKHGFDPDVPDACHCRVCIHWYEPTFWWSRAECV